MPVAADSPDNVYREQLRSLCVGLPLWNPNPPETIHNVAIGDVGYFHEGTFICMFNVMLPWDHPSNGNFGKPEPYKSLDCGLFPNIMERHFDRTEYYSSRVSVSTETNDNIQVHDR